MPPKSFFSLSGRGKASLALVCVGGLCLSLALLLWAAPAVFKPAAGESSAPTEEAIPVYYNPFDGTSQENAPQGPFLVTIAQNRIAVLRRDAPGQILLRLESPLPESLPAEDRALLRAGIKAESWGQVRGILEDYR